RHMGLAARFVSGYLIQLTPDVKALDGPSGTTVDFTDLHAWCEVFQPAPIEGVVDDAEVEFGHEMKVTRIYESPRVTKPYTEEQWAEVLTLGEAVDKRLMAGDVRLTMGGEPTYVAVSDRDAAEWNTDALGPTKRGYATELVHKLRAEYGNGGFLHFGQGKWYPGEQLPRWALNIFWRADGQKLWHDPELFADERHPTHYTSEDARRFTTVLAHKLGLTERYVQAGYEDVYYYLWRERRLPVNVDPFDSKLDDELERVRLRRVFTQKLDAVIGYMLPIEPTSAEADMPALEGPGWKTGPWFLRDDRLFLIPGDSPMGYRLPLDSQPWASKGDYPYLIDRDPSAPRDVLPSAAVYRARYTGTATAPVGSGTANGTTGELGDVPYAFGTPPATASALRMQGPGSPAAVDTNKHPVTRQPLRGESAHWVTRTALCVEVRDPRRANGPAAEKVGSASGVLYVFMPPLKRLEDY
ncbi:MAG: IMP dehydrogenase, partial [Comamonadaceae bacterium]